MVSVTWEDVRARRLARSALTQRAPADRLVDVVRDVCGVHAQVQASAELQLASRLNGIGQSDVREALWERRLLVKAWTLRGTLHLHPAAELALWHAARRAVAGPTDDLAAWQDPAGALHPEVRRAEVKAIRAAVWEALDEKCLLRDELADEVVSRVGTAHEERLRSGFAFFLGELCQGPPRGAKVTFVRPDQWIDGWQDIDDDRVLADICRRYLLTYGPARPSDFREWFAAPPFKTSQARTLFDSLGDELEEIDVEGHRAYVLAGDTAFPPLEPTLRLLPEYDVYVMGFRERDQLIPAVVKDQIAAHGRGRYEGPAGVRLLMIDGIAAGLWERKRRGKRIELRVIPARKLTRAQSEELDHEAERVAGFLGLELLLTVGR
jgi:Winged helix DNA-binding domain